MSEKNPNEEGPPYFSKETEDDYVDSPDTFVLWAERELQFGNMETAVEYLEKAIEEAKTYIDPKTPEKYKILLEELKAGKRTSLMGDPHKPWLPNGNPPSYDNVHEKEQEEKKHPSLPPPIFLLRVNEALQYGNIEEAIEILENGIKETEKSIDPTELERYKTYLEEIKSGKRTSLQEDSSLPSGVPPPYNPIKPIDTLKKRPEEQIQNEKRILTELYQERDEMQVKELAELFNLKEFDTLLALKLYIKQGIISARVFESSGKIKFLKDE
ncbi:MAG: hypothetical protein ACTSR8_06810 [Promethearchaeota archaeon]